MKKIKVLGIFLLFSVIVFGGFQIINVSPAYALDNPFCGTGIYVRV